MSTPLNRVFISLAGVLGAFLLYSLVAVPLVEPSVPGRAQAGDPVVPSRQVARHPELESLFAADSWERQNPKLLKTEHGMLLFQDYKPLGISKLELKPCSLVFYNEPNKPGQSPRPTVLRAPQRAILEFDGAVDLTRGQWGKLKGGRLEGEVTIHSPPSGPGRDDGVLVKTRNVEIQRQRIWTPHEVSFAWGRNYGSGRELRILMDPARQTSGGANKLALGAVRSLELAKVHKLNLFLPGRGLLDSKNPETPRPATLRNAANAPVTPIEVTCRGPFRFDVQAHRASFHDHVDVVRLNANGPADSLNCEELVIELEPRRTAEKQANVPGPAGNEASDTPAGKRKLPTLGLKSLRAVGHPVMLVAPSVDAQCRAENVEFNPATRVIKLRDPQQVWLRHKQREVQAPSLDYEVAEQADRLGRMWAAGPGRFRTVAKDSVANPPAAAQPVTSRPGGRRAPSTPAARTIDAAWQGEVRLSPKDGDHVLSIRDGAQVDVAGSGGFSADRIYIWLREVAAATPAKRAAPAPGAKKRKDRVRIQPVKMLAEGKVQFDSPRLAGNTQRIEVWLRDAAKPGATGPGGTGRAADTRIGQPRNPGRSPLGNRSPAGPPKSKFHLQGDLVRMQLVRRDGPTKGKLGQFAVEHVTVAGNLEITQIAGDRQRGPMQIHGDQLHLRHGAGGAAELAVTGRPARVSARGMTMSGNQLQLREQENRVWIDGAGWMTMPPGAGGTSQFGAGLQALKVQWSGLMDFDGRTAHFERGVQVHGTQKLKNGTVHELDATTDVLDVELTRDVDFRNPGASKGVEVRELVFHGGASGVVLRDRGTDSLGNPESLQNLRARNLAIDQKTGAVNAVGPGWAETLRYGKNVSSTVGEKKTPAGSGAAVRPPPVAAARPRTLIHMHIDFQEGIRGNLNDREFHFIDQVHVVYGPIRDWNQRLVRGDIQRLPTGGVQMDCDKLTVSDMGTKSQAELEMVALGNVFIEGKTKQGLFTARAHRLSYVQAKDQLVIEGDGRSDAQLSRQSPSGGPASRTAARKILFWRRDGRIKVDSFQFLDLRDLSP